MTENYNKLNHYLTKTFTQESLIINQFLLIQNTEYQILNTLQ